MHACDAEGTMSVLEYYNIEDADKDVNTIIVYAFSALFIVAGYLSMTYIRHQKR